MKLATHLVEKPWGRTDIPAIFAEETGRRIGEVWYDAPACPLPLLIKWLFTSERLSIQVHPDDAKGRAQGHVSGKEECWVVTAAEAGAVLGIGTKAQLDAASLRAASLDGTIEDLMDWKPVKAGDYFYIPAGTVHAIGAGVTLVEVQQNSDVTYRLYDYGRPRELHLDLGIAVSHAQPYADARCGQLSGANLQQLVAGPHFDLWHARDEAVTDLATGRPNCWLVPLAGGVSEGGWRTGPGECLYLSEPVCVAVEPGTAVLVAAYRAKDAKE